VVLPLSLHSHCAASNQAFAPSPEIVRLRSSATKRISRLPVRTSVLSLFLAGTARGNSLRPADARSACGYATPRGCGPSKTIQRPNDRLRRWPDSFGPSAKAALGDRTLSLFGVPREKREQKTEDFICTKIRWI